MDIALNFINNSNDHRSHQIVIFQKNLADPEWSGDRPEPDAGPQRDPVRVQRGQAAVAWKVIQRCGPGENHPFTVPEQMHVSTCNEWGNHTPRLAATHGEEFQALRTHSANTLQRGGAATSAQEVQVLNARPAGAIDAQIYRDGRLLAVKAAVAPGQRAVFRFAPTLFIGLAPGVVQGQVMSEAQVADIYTELSLSGVAAADVVMTGGGPGPDATRFEFSLDNIVPA